MKRWYGRVAIAAVVAAVAGLCSVAPAAQAQQSGPNPFASPTQFCMKHSPPPGARNSASPGITPNSIAMVEGSPDISNALRQGGNPIPQGAIYQALIDEINSCGGINGRKINMKKIPYNSFAADQVAHVTANCIKATEDFKAFLIINSTAPGIYPRCATVQHRAILMAGNAGLFGTEDQIASKGRLMSRAPATQEVSKAFISYALKHSLFKGAKVMVLGVQREASAAQDLEEQFVKPLRDKGIDVYLEVLPCIGGNNCRSQIDPVVARAKSRDVDRIITSQQFVLGTLGVLHKNMQERNLRARIVGPVTPVIHYDAVMANQLSDAGAAGARFASDVGETAYAFTDAGVVGAWRQGYKVTPFGQLCLDTVNRRLNNKPAWNAGRIYQENGFWTAAAAACKEVRSLARALWSLGNNVTTDRAVVALAKEVPERVEGFPAFDAYTWYTLAHPSVTKMAPLKYHYPCVDSTPARPCMIPQDSPIRARPVD